MYMGLRLQPQKCISIHSEGPVTAGGAETVRSRPTKGPAGSDPAPPSMDGCRETGYSLFPLGRTLALEAQHPLGRLAADDGALQMVPASAMTCNRAAAWSAAAESRQPPSCPT